MMIFFFKLEGSKPVPSILYVLYHLEMIDKRINRTIILLNYVGTMMISDDNSKMRLSE